MFWFTTDLNVFWVPDGSLVGKYVGDKLQSTVSTLGIESTNIAALKQVWMTYFDHILMLGIPTGTDNFATTQFWMDMRMLRMAPEKGPVWYGPMTGQSVNRVWVENQQGDNALYGLEGDATAKGLYVYQLRVPSQFTDASGSNDVAITMTYQSMFMDQGIPSREKYVQAAHLDLNNFTGTSTLDLVDLNGTMVSGVPVEAVP
jgi:hypothetical protein